MQLTATWEEYTAEFVCPSNASSGKLSFYFGAAAAGTHVWINSPTLVGLPPRTPPVMRRDFDCGVALLNGDTAPRTIDLAGEGLHRLTGTQAPRWQYFVDDNSTRFHTESGAAWAVENFDSGYSMQEKAQEQVRPPAGFAHHWGVGAHRARTTTTREGKEEAAKASAPAAASAAFDLKVPESGLYTVKLWWPDAGPTVRSTWSTAMSVSIVPAPPPPPPAHTHTHTYRHTLPPHNRSHMRVAPGSKDSSARPQPAVVLNLRTQGGVRTPTTSVSSLLYPALQAATCLRLTCYTLPCKQPRAIRINRHQRQYSATVNVAPHMD